MLSFLSYYILTYIISFLFISLIFLQTLNGIDVPAPVTHLSFTSNGKFLIAMTGSPSFSLYYIDWQRGSFGRVVAICKNVTTLEKPVSHVDSAPNDSGLVCVTGTGLFKMYRLIEKEEAFRPLPTNFRREPVALTGHAWMPDNDRLMLVTRTGELLVAEGGDVKKTLDAPTDGIKPVHSIIATSKGFLLGCEGGLLRVYEKAEDARNFYKVSRQYPLQVAPPVSAIMAKAAGTVAPADGTNAVGIGAEIIVGGKVGSTIVAMSLSPTEDDVVIATAVGQHFVFHLAANELQKASEAVFHPLLAPVHQVLQLPDGNGSPEAPLPQPATSVTRTDPRVAHFQNAGITGIATCLRKPIFITCGGDKTVRVWNLTGASLNHTGVSSDGGSPGSSKLIAPEVAPALEVVQRFSEVPTCVSLHPSGILTLIGFEGSLQLHAIMMDAIRLVKELPLRSVADVHFSSNGSMFACASGSVVVVYNTYGCLQLCSLRGHSDRVHSICWSRDDRTLVTAGKDGMIARWNIVVPNATSAGTAPGPAASSGTRRSSTTGEGVGPLALVGKMTHSVEVRDLLPFCITNGASSNNMDVYVSGTHVKGVGSSAVLNPMLKHIDFTTATKAEPAKATAQLNGSAPHSLFVARNSNGTPYAVLAGTGALVSPRPGQSAAGGAGSAAAAASAASTTTTSSTTALSSSLMSSGDVDTSGVIRVFKPHLVEKEKQASSSSSSANGEGSSVQPVPAATISSYVDFVCHSGPVTCMKNTPDNKILITGSTDGSLALWTVSDPALLKKDSTSANSSASVTDTTTSWSEETCVTKRDLDAILKEKSDLEASFAAVTLQIRYSEREKDIENETKFDEIKAKFADDVENEHVRLATLREQRESMEQRFEEQMADLEMHQHRDLADLETLYMGKISGEIQRYDRLVKERDRMNTEYEIAMNSLKEEQEHDLSHMRADYEARVGEEDAAVAELESASAQLTGESRTTAVAIERDVDKEIEDMRARFETRLVLESKATLLLKGENGFMKRKFVAVSKDLADQKEEVQALADREKEFVEAISSLQKDVSGHKKEVKEREDTIAEKDARINELKKKNQELEKFKFVLNYKIQELKRQVMPKKKEIADLRDQLKEMEMELLQYHKSNAALDLMIGDLKMKRDGMAGEVRKLRSELSIRDDKLIEVGRDVLAVHQCINDVKTLKNTMVHLYRKFIYGDRTSLALTMTQGSGGGLSSGGKKESLAKSLSTHGLSVLPPGVNLEDLQSELTHQRQHLEKGVDGLKRRIEKEEATAGQDRARLLRENSVLTQEINDLRRDVKYLHGQLELTLNAASSISSSAPPPPLPSNTSRRTTAVFGITKR
jgi:WD40 repeat protein